MRAQSIPADAKFIRGHQAFNSGRWPMGRDTFYRLVREGHITRRFPMPGGRPVFSVEEIDTLFADEPTESTN
jgi:predicted DNA-binding transcriptional regulator AlpA